MKRTDPNCDTLADLGTSLLRYDANDDFTKSIEEAYRVIRERMKAGGPGWAQKEYKP